MAQITLDGVSKSFGSTSVVERVDLEIADGEFLVLVGPSGCGKTTTLRMIAGLETITSGTISIGDRIINDVAPKDRDIGMVFQNYALYPHMTVADNMRFGLKLHKVEKAETERRVTETAELLGLTKVLDRKPKALSGGQRQRVALGRAIVREPSVFLMDEPLSNLDAKLRVGTRTEILRLHKRLKSTIVYVTHDQVEAMTMADRIVVMKDGVVQQIARPRELYDRPDNLFVASFIGSPQMNFLDVTIVRDGGRATARRAGSDGAIPLPPGVPQPAGTVTLGIRPEDVVLASGAAGAGTLAATVDVIETLGAEQFVFLNLADGGQLVARVSGDLPVRSGDRFAATLTPEKIHLFDPGTGNRIAPESAYAPAAMSAKGAAAVT